MTLTVYHGVVDRLTVSCTLPDEPPEVVGFWAELVDTETGQNLGHDHLFHANKINPDDRYLVAPGARFYYMIRRDETGPMPHTMVTSLTFIRMHP